uniref:Putative secreted peptide n=1 Tax=Anopheles braziliensis TaxID=58242 RepID=A0A2M3ZXH8_9DIPT
MLPLCVASMLCLSSASSAHVWCSSLSTVVAFRRDFSLFLSAWLREDAVVGVLAPLLFWSVHMNRHT